MKNRWSRIKFAWMTLLLAGISGTSYLSFAQDTLTIEQALTIAEENNPALMNSKLNLERYQQNLVAQRASLKSRFSLDLNPIAYTRTRSFDNRISQWYTNERYSSSGTFQVDQPILLTDGVISLVNTFGWQNNESTDIEGINTRDKAFTNNLNLRLRQPVFTHNTRKLELKRIEFAYENAGISYALARLQMEANITSQFYTVYMAQNNLEIRKEEYENAKQSYEIIKNKVEADLSAKEELYQAEVNLATAQSALEEQIASLEERKDNLKQVLGIPLSENINVKADIKVHPVIVNLEQAVNNGMASRMELRQREIDMELQDLQMIVTKSENEFRGDITLSVGIVGDNEVFRNMYDNPTQNPSVGITFAVPIFDWGEKKARVRAQKTAQTIAKLDHENERITIELEIRKVWRELEKNRAQISIAEKNVRNAQLTYDLNLTRYREGDLTGMEISQFQTQLSSKKITYSQTLIDYKISLLNLKIGALYDFENDKPIVPIRELTSGD